MAIKVKHVMMVLAVLGLLVSVYLTLYHYAGIPLLCSESGIINCNNVLNSSYSILFGVPIAVYGIVFFVVEILLLLKLHSRLKDKDLIVIYNTLGIAFVVYFVYTEYVIGNVCIFCTAVHVITVALFILSFFENERILL